MIKTAHAAIRTAEPDDAAFLLAFYDQWRPRAALLDGRREPMMPTLSDLRELLGRKEAVQGQFFAVEDLAGEVRGFCSLRGMNPEASFGELTLLLEDATYATPLADEAFGFIQKRAFVNLHLQRVLAHALAEEAAWRAFLVRQGFFAAGAFREAFFGGGRYHDIVVYSLIAPEPPALAACSSSPAA